MNKMIHDTENCHWRDARWFEQNRGVSRYTLKGHNEAGRVRSFKGGSAIQSRRVWCVEDYDAIVAEERRLAANAAEV